jgi:hypothetical protein
MVSVLVRNKKGKRDWRCSLVEECVFSMYKALGLFLLWEKEEKDLDKIEVLMKTEVEIGVP